jgi:hypothetical protein
MGHRTWRRWSNKHTDCFGYAFANKYTRRADFDTHEYTESY